MEILARRGQEEARKRLKGSKKPGIQNLVYEQKMTSGGPLEARRGQEEARRGQEGQKRPGRGWKSTRRCQEEARKAQKARNPEFCEKLLETHCFMNRK